MAINLNTSDESTLLLKITEQVQRAQVRKIIGVYTGRDNINETIEQLSEPLAERLKKILDDTKLRGFVRNELVYEFFKSDHEFPTEKSKYLSEFKEFKDPLVVARKLVATLSSLPNQYRIVVKASKTLSSIVKKTREQINFKISDRLSLVTYDKLPDGFNLYDNKNRLDQWIRSERFVDDSQLVLEAESLYFVYRTSGYISDRYDSKLIREISDELRAFYGVCIASGILDDYNYFWEEVSPWIASHKLKYDGEELSSLNVLDSDLTKATYIDTTSRTDERVSSGEMLVDILKPVKDMFNCEDSSKYKTAAIWLLRAYLSPRSMDKVLESTIAIEVLLGDRETSDRIGLSKLMANRCGYSLGRSAFERKEITEFFVKYYRVRSEVVHSGRFYISEAESDVVEKGLALASRILIHEIKLSNN